MCCNGKRSKKFWILAAIFGPLAIAAAVFVFGSVVMLLWNAILPGLFGVGTINFWQALGILVLSKILFGGFGGHRGHGRWGRHHNERWMHLGPEERERMKAAWRSRCQPNPETE
jgi:hypothetical protein